MRHLHFMPPLALCDLAAACQPPRAAPPAEMHAGIAPSAPSPLVLDVAEGERRQRRAQTSGLSSPFIIKVDPQNGGWHTVFESP